MFVFVSLEPDKARSSQLILVPGHNLQVGTTVDSLEDNRSSFDGFSLSNNIRGSSDELVSSILGLTEHHATDLIQLSVDLGSLCEFAGLSVEAVDGDGVSFGVGDTDVTVADVDVLGGELVSLRGDENLRGSEDRSFGGCGRGDRDGVKDGGLLARSSDGPCSHCQRIQRSVRSALIGDTHKCCRVRAW